MEATAPPLATEFAEGVGSVLSTEIGSHTLAFWLGAAAVVGVGIYYLGKGLNRLVNSNVSSLQGNTRANLAASLG